MTVYMVWTKCEYEPVFLALFTNEQAANEYANKRNGVVYPEYVYTLADEVTED